MYSRDPAHADTATRQVDHGAWERAVPTPWRTSPPGGGPGIRVLGGAPGLPPHIARPQVGRVHVVRG